MDTILQFIKDNLAILLSIPSIGTILLLIARWFVTKELPRWKNAILKLFARLISNMFGITYEDGEDLVEALPFVNDFKNMSTQMKQSFDDYIGMKLIEMKQKLTSPVYTEIEKAPIQELYNYYYNKYRNFLPKTLVDALDSIKVQE